MSPKTTQALLTLTTMIGVLPISAAEWPQYRGPALDGSSGEKLTAKTWGPTGPRTVWKVPASGGFSSLTVSEGRVFTVVGRSIDGVAHEVLVALDAESGREIWSAPSSVAKFDGGGNSGTKDNSGGDGPRSTPSVVGGRVYLLDGRLVLSCREAASGREVWRRDLIAEHAGRNITWQNAASPVVEGDLVFVAGGGEGQALLGIDRHTGKTVWKGQDDRMTHATPVVSTLLGERQVVFFTQTGLVSVRPADGDVLWRQPFRFTTSTAASPVIADDLVYCSAGYGVGAGAYRIAKDATGYRSTQVWRAEGKLQNHWSTPVLYQGHLYGMFGFKEYGACPLKCVEVATGREKWSQAGFGPGNVTRVEGHLIALSDAGELVLVEATPTAYRETARADVLEGKCWSTPTYAGGRIYARSTREAVCVELGREHAGIGVGVGSAEEASRVALRSAPQRR